MTRAGRSRLTHNVTCLRGSASEVSATVNKELMLEFFLTFSRFEYALKATEMFKRHRPVPTRTPRAEPDWDRFSASLRDNFNASATKDLAQACEYLCDSPPNQQVIVDDAVAWETPTRADGEADVQFLLRMVRSVRNNLFHGGKHNIEVHEDIQRTEMLLKSSVTILDACLTIAPKQQAAYLDARL